MSPARFGYEGLTAEGALRHGHVEGTCLADAAGRTRALGIDPFRLRREDTEALPVGPTGVEAFATFNRGLARMLRVGIPLPLAVRDLASGLRCGRFRESLGRIEADLREGKPLDQAVLRGGEDFPAYYHWMLRAGALSGNLPAVLLAVARNSEGVLRARKALVQALAYPACVVLTGGAMLSGFFAFMLPRYLDLYRRHAVEPPLGLRALGVVADSPLIVVAVLCGITACCWAVWRWMRRTPTGERLLFFIPGVGRAVRLLVLGRFFGCLGVLLRSRTPLPDALPVASGASGGVRLARQVERLRAKAADGNGLAQALAGMELAGSEALGYLSLAERTGRVPEAVEELSDFFMEESTAASESLYVILFPSAMLVIGVLLASVILPVTLSYFDFIRRVVMS